MRARTRKGGRWLLTVLLVLLAADSHAAGLQRSEGFESYATGTLTAGILVTPGYWEQDNGRIFPDIVTSALDAGAGPHGGSKMVRFNYDTTNPSTGWSSLHQVSAGISFTNEIFYRWWVRFDADHGLSNLGSQRKFGRIFVTTPAYNDIFLEVSPGFFITIVLVNGDYPGVQHSLGLTPTGWNQVELYISKSPTAGVVKLWINDTLVESYTGLNTSAAPWLDFYPVSNWGDVENSGYLSGVDNHLYLDDFEVYSDAGTGATGSMADGTITQGGGGGGDGTIALILAEWAPLACAVGWHFRTAIISGMLVLVSMGSATVGYTKETTKQIAYTTTLSTLNLVNTIAQKVRR